MTGKMAMDRILHGLSCKEIMWFILMACSTLLVILSYKYLLMLNIFNI